MRPDQMVPHRIMIVDADSAFSDALAAALRSRGCVVMQTAPEVTDRMLERFETDILLWDIGGRGTGDLLAQIENIRPLLRILPMARRPNRRRVIVNGSSPAFLDKSLGLESALATIRHCLAQRNTGDRASIVSGAKAEETKGAEIEFLAKISHELRTPLNAIIGFSELIIRDSRTPLDEQQQRSYVQDIHASGRHLLEVINDILDFAKAESGKLTLQESETDIAEVLTSINRLLGPQIRDAGLQFSQSLPEHLTRLWCDERKLKRMLLNLMTNAVKATPAGGRIDVEVSDTPAGIVISVHDTGVGISKEDLPRVLEPFVQVENSFSRRHEGTGLGLSLVKAMIEIHGGNIRLESELNKGTIAQLIFPRDRLATSTECAYQPTRSSV
jgi:signal transduction histidine kinase